MKKVCDKILDAEGKIDGYKARHDAKGFSQIPGIYFDGLFSAGPRYTTISFMLALAVRNTWKRRIIDVKYAFQNAPLKEELFFS